MALSKIIPGTTPFGQWASTPPIPPAGTSDAKVIARFRTVPYQTRRKVAPLAIDRQIIIAVNCGHINGIDRVEFAAQGGNFVSVNRPLQTRFSPTNFDPPLASAPSPTFQKWWRYGCYAAILDASDFTGASGLVEVRAKIYTPDGLGRILQNSDGQDLGDKSLIVWIDTGDGTSSYNVAYISPPPLGDDSTGQANNPLLPFATPGAAMAAASSSGGGSSDLGGVRVLARNGDYVLNRPALNPFDATKRWSVIEPDLASGATKAGVRIIDSQDRGNGKLGLGIGLLRLKDVTLIKAPRTTDESEQSDFPATTWLDSVHCESTQQTIDTAFPEGVLYPQDNPGGQFITDTTATVIDRFAEAVTLVDRCTVSRTKADALKNTMAAYDSDFTQLGEFVAGEHVDGIQWAGLQGFNRDNIIYDSLRFYNDDFSEQQTMFFRSGNATGKLRNVAIVNIVAVPGGTDQSQWRLDAEHLIILHMSHDALPWWFRDDEQAGNPPGPPIARTLKNVLVLGFAMHQLKIDTTNILSLVVTQNVFETGVNWQAYGSNTLLNADAGWTLPLLTPVTGGNLADRVTLWTAPADAVGADRPFTPFTAFSAYAGAYQP